MRDTAAPGRSLLPQEHGAYGQLGVPLATALGLGRPTVSALSLAASFVLAFFAHEPLLVLLGHRGDRARRDHAARARRTLLVLALGAVALFGLGVASAPREVRPWLAAVAVLAVGSSAFVARRSERTLVGELVIAATLAATLVPVALAEGVDVRLAVSAFAVYAAGFACATLAVRATIARVKRTREAAAWPTVTLSAAVLAAFVVAWSLGGIVPASVPLAFAPTALLALLLALVPVHTRHLKRVGWLLVGSSVTTMALLVVMMR